MSNHPALLGFLLTLLTSVGNAVPLSSFYPYGITVGDSTLVPNDDETSTQIPLSTAFNYFGKSQTSLFVSNNGDLTFQKSFPGYSPVPFPFSSVPMIAPFLADVDTRAAGSGYVWYRNTTDASLLAKAAQDIPSTISGPNFSPVWLFVATWDHVGYYGRHNDKTNTFQCVLVADKSQSFVIYQYADGGIQWTTGDASGGVNGLGGVPAQVGFDAGDRVNYYNVPASRTPNIINITQTSNVNVPGQWIFQVQDHIASPDVPAPLNFTLSSIRGQPNALNASWSAPSVRSDEITAYKVYCSTSDSQAYPEQVIGLNQSIVTFRVNGTFTSALVTGLNPFTQYNCYVAASISSAEGPGSSKATNRTDESTPSAPTNFALSTVSRWSNQITATWTPPIPKNGIITAYTLYCNYSPAGIIIKTITNGATLMAVINVDTDTFVQHNCYVTANTSVGEGTQSHRMTLVTAPPSPLNFTLTPVPGSPYQLLTTWSAPPIQNGAITAYTVYCNVSSIQAYPEQAIGPNLPTAILVVNGATFSALINTNLSPYTQYECFVTANTSAGEGRASMLSTARTSESVPVPPLNFSLTPVSGSPYQLLATWSAPSIPNGAITAYTVYCNVSNTQAYAEQVIGSNPPTARLVVNGTTFSALLSMDLSPYTQYECYITANTSVGEGQVSMLRIARTSESIPSAPIGMLLYPDSDQSDQLIIKWTPPMKKNGIIVAYNVYCRTSATQPYTSDVVVVGPDSPTIRSIVNETSANATIIRGLKPFTSYDCFMTANTSTGEGNASVLVTNTTAESTPSAPRNFTLSTDSQWSNRINATWAPPISKNGIITAYTVYCNVSSMQAYPEQVIGPNAPTVRSVVNGRAVATSISMNLSPYTQYECYITANTSAGEGAASMVNIVRTSESINIANGLDLILKISVSISGALLISLLVMVIMICFLVKANKRRRKVRKTTPVWTEQRSYISLIQNKRPSISQDFKDILQSSLITYAHLQCEKVPIGEGAFGKVYKGLLIVPGHTAEQVAIKTINNTLSDEDIRSFVSESAVMATFNHPNVLGLYGVCFDSPDGTPLMVLPYMVNGSLKSYLVKSRNHQSGKCDIYPDGLGFAVMIKMCTDIARGMSYLTDKRIVHRDLAARNCLLDHDLSVKIGDFGLSRDVYMTDYYRASSRGPLPVKWMPPEMLRDVISNEKTDVWAYGVTCWEVFSLGATPYPGVDNHQVLEHLTNGFRPAKPALCTDEIYGLLRRCWSERPEERPCFSEILIEIDALTGAHYYI